MKELEYLVLFQEHSETHHKICNNLDDAKEQLVIWKAKAEKNYPYYEWDKEGLIFKGKQLEF